MKRGTVIFLFALFPLIPASATLAYAIVVSAALLWYFLTGILFRYLVSLADPGKAGPVAELLGLAGSAAIFLEFLKAFSPVLAVTLSFHVTLSAFTFILLVSIDRFPDNDGIRAPILRFIPFFLGFAAVRELLAFGSLSIPSGEGILSLPVLPAFDSYRLGFWGTTGGALILLGFITWVAKNLNRRLAAYRRNSR